jgi:hypothetical protein
MPWGNYLEDRSQHLSIKQKLCPCREAPIFWSVNWAAALLHLFNTVATIGLWATSDDKDQVFKLSENYAPWVPLTNGTCPQNAFKVSDEWCVSKLSKDTTELSLWWLVIAFHFLSFAFQTLAMADWDITCCKLQCKRKRYVSEIREDGTNSLRMIEYSISATLMQISIALILGVWDRLTIVGIAFLTAVTMLQGLVAEKIKYTDIEMAWVSHLSGWVSMGGVWFIIGRQFLFTIENSGENPPPDFVYIIVTVIALLYIGFGLVQLVELCLTRKSKSAVRHERVELAYCTLSLVSKTFLGWMIFANALSGMAENN